MALTPEDTKALNAIFAPEQHEFNRGFVYITERAVCDRLEAVDPSWNFDLKSVQVRDSDVVVIGSLTLKGVTREGVGMQKIMEKAGEAEKGAATDALKRAARLFGVGRYLLDAPEERQFAAWLAKQAGQPAQPAANGNHFAGLPEVQPPAPATSWTQEQAASFNTECKQKGVTPAEALGVLGVAKLSEFQPGFSAARKLLTDYLKARPAQPAQEEQVAF